MNNDDFDVIAPEITDIGDKFDKFDVCVALFNALIVYFDKFYYINNSLFVCNFSIILLYYICTTNCSDITSIIYHLWHVIYSKMWW